MALRQARETEKHAAQHPEKLRKKRSLNYKSRESSTSLGMTEEKLRRAHHFRSPSAFPHNGRKFPETFSSQSGEEGDERPDMTPKTFGAREGQNEKGN